MKERRKLSPLKYTELKKTLTFPNAERERERERDAFEFILRQKDNFHASLFIPRKNVEKNICDL